MKINLAQNRFGLLTVAALGLLSFAAASSAQDKLLNVSYDPTRELYKEYDKAFAKHWKETSGKDVAITTTHGGSGKQARGVIDGVEADVVTLALADDINVIADKAKLIPRDWQKKLPNNSAPYTSTIVFLVRKGNPKGIKDWDDLVKPNIGVITPNPKTSGGARWNFLAAWEYAKRKYGSEDQAKDFVSKLYKNVKILDSGARGSTNTFAVNGIGDVLLAWENEALLEKKLSPSKFDIVVPSLSILAEPTVAVVAINAGKHGTLDLAKAYLEYLYSDEGQDLAGKHFYRPSGDKAKAKYASQFSQVELVTIDGAFGGWPEASKKFFAEEKIFDQIYKP